MDPRIQKIKENLLEDLIEKMSDMHGESMKPKSMAVEVAAPDKEHLKEGLDNAKGVLGSMPEDSEEDEIESPSEEDDEKRLMELLEKEDDEK